METLRIQPVNAFQSRPARERESNHCTAVWNGASATILVVVVVVVVIRFDNDNDNDSENKNDDRATGYSPRRNVF
ncbi:hypothetical protein CCR95_03480 [Thiocystis minor]|nr:hypothetical protein [Thiocystis minor]